MQPFESLLFVALFLSAFTSAHTHVENRKLSHNALILQPRQAPKSAAAASAGDQDESTGWKPVCHSSLHSAAVRVCLRVSSCNKNGKLKSRDTVCFDICECEREDEPASASGGGDAAAGEGSESKKGQEKKGKSKKYGEKLSRNNGLNKHGGRSRS
jgi:hypothetical protein